MARPHFDADFAAAVLIDAAFTTDEAAADKHGVTRQTVGNYRKRLKTDSEFLQVFALRMNGLREELDWEGRMPATLRAALAAMERCFTDLNPKNPATLSAITEAVTAMTDALLTLRILDASLHAHTSAGQADEVREVSKTVGRALA